MDTNEYLVISRGRWDASLSPEQIQAAIDAFYHWHAQLVEQGRMKPGQRLAREARLVTKLRTIDGPYTEAKEVIGGYSIMEFRDKEEAMASAVEFMQLHMDLMPGWEGTCEVRAFAGFAGT